MGSAEGLQSYLEEIVEVLEDTDADFIQVLEEAVEDGNQVRRRQLVAQDDRQFVDGERQRAAHFPLRGRRQTVKLLGNHPV